MKRNTIRIIDIVLLLGVIGAIVSLVWMGLGRGDISFSPEDSQYTSNVLFQLGDAERILVSDNSELESAKEYSVSNDLEIPMKKGVYYWGIEYRDSIIVRRFELNVPATFVIVDNANDGSFYVMSKDSDLSVTAQRGGSEKTFILKGWNSE